MIFVLCPLDHEVITLVYYWSDLLDILYHLSWQTWSIYIYRKPSNFWYIHL